MKTVKVKVKRIGSNFFAYPDNGLATGFCALLRQESLNRENIRHIKDLGYVVRDQEGKAV